MNTLDFDSFRKAKSHSILKSPKKAKSKPRTLKSSYNKEFLLELERLLSK